MSSEFSNLNKIPLLQGSTNYTEWAMEIEATTQLGKFWRAYGGQDKAFDTSAAAHEAYQNRLESAYGLIKKTVIKTIAIEIRGPFPNPSEPSKPISDPKPHEIWSYLRDKYSKKGGVTAFLSLGLSFIQIWSMMALSPNNSTNFPNYARLARSTISS